MIGQTISHYKIISKLGEGGFGVVDRDVALKFLPRDVMSSVEKSRLLYSRSERFNED